MSDQALNPWKKEYIFPNNSQYPSKQHEINFPTLNKIMNLRAQQKQNYIHLQTEGEKAERKQKIKEKLKQNLRNQIFLEQLKPQNQHSKEEFFRSTKKKTFSSLQMCKINANSYDELKKEVIHSKNKNKERKENITKTFYINSLMFTPKKLVSKNLQKKLKGSRKVYFASQQKNHKSARYADVSVSDFIESNHVENHFEKKFQEFRRETQRPRSLTN